MEKQGIPTVTINTTSFSPLMKTVAQTSGVPNLPAATIPHPLSGLPEKEARARADAAIDDIIYAATHAAAKVEMPATPDYRAETVMVKGTIDDVFQVFYEKDWTDGLPIIPPTRERVEKMLEGTSHKADEIIGELPPCGGIATVERIAINAVMAGCKPEYLPVVLAAVEAIADPENNMAAWATTTACASPLLIVNGPIRDELDINYGTNCLGTGHQANAAIGRSINLITRNIGGAIPGVTDMTTFGGAWEYTNCLGENEGALPPSWEPLNVERGYAPETSTVTVESIISQISILGHQAREFKQIVDTIVAEVVGVNSVFILLGMELVLDLNPEAVALAGKDGWSKKDIKQYLFEKARQPLRDWKYLGDNILSKELYPEAKTESDDYMMRMIPKPEDIIIISAGGPGSMSVWWIGGMGKAVTKSIDKWR